MAAGQPAGLPEVASSGRVPSVDGSRTEKLIRDPGGLGLAPRGRLCANHQLHMSSRFGLRIVAVFEGAKGLIVLAAGMGLFGLVHHDVQAAVEWLVRHFMHLNPASHYPRIFIEAAGRIDDAHLRMLAAAALVYSVVRFTEGYGLWRDRRWAEWFGAVSGGIYLPLEIYKLWERITWPRVTILVVNIAVVIYLVHVLLRGHDESPKAIPPSSTAAAP